MTINHTEERSLQNTVEANVLAHKVRVLHVLSISKHRYNSCVEPFNLETQLLNFYDGSWLQNNLLVPSQFVHDRWKIEFSVPLLKCLDTHSTNRSF